MKTEDFDFELDPQLIAQQPLADRADSRLLVLRRADGSVNHRRFRELPSLLRNGDALVVNDTSVIPAKFAARRQSGGQIEGLFLLQTAPDQWQVLLRNAGRCKPGERLDLTLPEGAEPAVRSMGILPACAVGILPASAVGVPPASSSVSSSAATQQQPTQRQDGGKMPPALAGGTPTSLGHAHLRLMRNMGEGRWLVEVNPALPAPQVLERYGVTPLPPYIRRPAGRQDIADKGRYQTVYAQTPGAVAAPTAGLHFTPELLAELASMGVRTVPVTLHVGMGTFLPVKADDIAEHQMHSEWYDLPATSAEALNAVRAAGGRIIAVGTTAIRVLETAAAAQDISPGQGGFSPAAGWTDIFIYPPRIFRAADALITNFHLPRSTLLMLVAAFCEPGGAGGIPMILNAYRQAIAERYRFFSYGDAMFIE